MFTQEAPAATAASEGPEEPGPGQILFNPPSHMRAGHTERIEVRIVRNLETDLTTGLKGTGTPQIEQQRVSQIMRVTLTGDDFEITSFSEAEQVIDARDFTEWSFSVTPLKGGLRTLHLAISMVLDIPGRGEKARTLPVIDRPIQVEVDPLWAARRFTKENWEWLASSIALPLIALGYTRYTRRGRKKKDKEEDEDEG